MAGNPALSTSAHSEPFVGKVRGRGERPSLKQKIDKELLCNICLSRLHQPKTLTQCSHSFCQVCLEELFVYAQVQSSPANHLQQNELECPTCRTVTTLPERGVAGLPTSYALRNVAEIILEEPEGSEPQIEYQEKCQLHNCVLDQYCSACNELLCGECIHDPRQKEHFQSGEIHLARKFLPEYLKSLSPKLELASELVLHTERLEHEVERRREVVSTNSQEAKTAIDTFFKEMAEHIEQRRKALTAAVDSTTDTKLAAIEKHGKQVAERKSAAIGTADSMKKLQHSSDIHDLTKGKAIDKALQAQQQALSTIDAHLQNKDSNLFLSFQADKSFRERISAIGGLAMCRSGPDSSLTVDHYLKVGKDGNIFRAPSGDNNPYMQVVPVAAQAPDYPPPRYPVFRFPQPQFTIGPPQAQGNIRPLQAEYENVQLIKDVHTAASCSELDRSGSIPTDMDREGDYDEIPGSRPPLPPDNSSRKLGMKQRQRAITLPNRLSPEVVQPVKVVTSAHLHEPGTVEMVYPTGIQCTGSFDNITITDVHNHCLRQIDQHGEFSQSIGSKGKAGGEFDTPAAIALGADDDSYLYVVDQANSRVQKLTIHGEFVTTFGKKHLRTPTGVAISRINGNVYVSDSKKQRVYVYRNDCTYERPIGKHEKDIRFEHPIGVAFDSVENLLVVDRGQVPCVWHISQPDGALLGKIGEGYLHHPSNVTASKDGLIFVTERGKVNCVSVFSPQGNVIRCFGKTGFKPGEFNGPSGVAVNSQGQIIVADQYNQRLQIFDLEKVSDSGKDSLLETV